MNASKNAVFTRARVTCLPSVTKRSSTQTTAPAKLHIRRSRTIASSSATSLLIRLCVGFARVQQPVSATISRSAVSMTSVLPPNESPSLPSVLDGEQLDDPRTWLEDVDGEKQLEWAKACNAETAAQLGDPSQSPLFAKLANILDSKEKIPYIGEDRFFEPFLPYGAPHFFPDLTCYSCL